VTPQAPFVGEDSTEEIRLCQGLDSAVEMRLRFRGEGWESAVEKIWEVGRGER